MDLNKCMHQFENLNHDHGEFREYLVTFNTPPLPSRLSASSLTTLEKFINIANSPGGLVDNQTKWRYMEDVEYFSTPQARLSHTPTTFGASPPQKITIFGVPVDLPRLSEQSPPRHTSVRPFSFKHENLPVHLPLPPSPPPHHHFLLQPCATVTTI